MNKTAEKWGLEVEDIRALTQLVEDRAWRVLREMFRQEEASAEAILTEAEDLHKILRAQGRKRAMRTLQQNIETIVKEAVVEQEQE